MDHPQKIPYAIRGNERKTVSVIVENMPEGENILMHKPANLTREPAQEISFIHDRMPVIFSDRNHGAWLDRSANPQEVLKHCEISMAYKAA